MENCRNRRIPLTLVLLVVAVSSGLGTRIANAEEPPFDVPSTIVVSTGPDAAVIDADAHASKPGANPTASSRPRRICRLEAIETTGYIEGLGPVSLPGPPGMVPYSLTCDDGTSTVVWRKENPGNTSPVSAPQDVARHLREEIPVPKVDIKVNPSIGLVGAESWFWIEGYSGQPIADSTDAFGQLVEVEAKATRYDWSFGDGVVFSSDSVGAAYPNRSEIRHTYERSSAATGIGYPVRVNFVFAVRYRVGGGSWIDLPGISRTAGFRYPVRETQAVISR